MPAQLRRIKGQITTECRISSATHRGLVFSTCKHLVWPTSQVDNWTHEPALRLRQRVPALPRSPCRSQITKQVLNQRRKPDNTSMTHQEMPSYVCWFITSASGHRGITMTHAQLSHAMLDPRSPWSNSFHRTETTGRLHRVCQWEGAKGQP